MAIALPRFVQTLLEPPAGFRIPAFFPHFSLWIGMAVSCIVMIGWLAVSSISIDFGTAWQLWLMAGWMIFLALRYGKAKPVIGALCWTGAYVLAMSQILRPMTYLATGAGFPLIDAQLAAFDASIGFDWNAHVAWVNASPWLVTVLYETYMLILNSMFALLALLLATRRWDRIGELIWCMGMLSLASIPFCLLTPAIGAYAWYQPAAQIIANIPADAGRYHLEQFTALRDGSQTYFDLAQTNGIVTFPSFHTIVPVLGAWALRRTWAFWPVTAGALLMVLSTLAIGGHHLADVLAGIALCALAIWVYHRLIAPVTLSGSRELVPASASPLPGA